MRLTGPSIAPKSTVMVTAPSGDVRVPDMPGTNRNVDVTAAKGIAVADGALMRVLEGAAGA